MAGFEVYRVAPDTFAIYEPHQSEETISYLIVGRTRAMLFDTGWGSAIEKIDGRADPAAGGGDQLAYHKRSCGQHWQFDTVYSMDTSFSRHNAQGSREAAQAEIQPGETCGNLPAGFDPKAYVTGPWKITSTCTMASGSIWEGGGYRLLHAGSYADANLRLFLGSGGGVCCCSRMWEDTVCYREHLVL